MNISNPCHSVKDQKYCPGLCLKLECPAEVRICLERPLSDKASFFIYLDCKISLYLKQVIYCFTQVKSQKKPKQKQTKFTVLFLFIRTLKHNAIFFSIRPILIFQI